MTVKAAKAWTEKPGRPGFCARKQAEYQRRYRARRRAGVVPIQIYINEVDVPEALIAAGLLDRAEAEDRKKVARAIEKAVEFWASALGVNAQPF